MLSFNQYMFCYSYMFSQTQLYFPQVNLCPFKSIMCLQLHFTNAGKINIFYIFFCEKYILQSFNSTRHHCSGLGGSKGASMKPQDRSFKAEPSSCSKRCPSGSPKQSTSAACDAIPLSGRARGKKYSSWHSSFRLTHMD